MAKKKKKSLHNADCCSVKNTMQEGQQQPEGGNKMKALFKKMYSDGAFQEINFLKCDT